MRTGRLYMYYEDRTYGSTPVPMFIPEGSLALSAPEHHHLPVITEEEFKKKKDEWEKAKKTQK